MAVRKTDEQFKKEVFDLVGDEYTVIGDYKNAGKHLTFRHNHCGFEWSTTPSMFLKGSRCFECHMLSTRKTQKELDEKVYALVGDAYKFVGAYVKYEVPIKCRHNVCGHIWEVSPYRFLSYFARCPKCPSSSGEEAVEHSLIKIGIDYIKEHSFPELPRRRFDFYLPSINAVIEFDGGQHFHEVELWGGSDSLERNQKADILKNDLCSYLGVDLLRIPYWEFRNVDEIVTNFVTTTKALNDILYSSP